MNKPEMDIENDETLCETTESAEPKKLSLKVKSIKNVRTGLKAGTFCSGIRLAT